MCWSAREAEVLAAEEQARAEIRRHRERAEQGVNPASDPRPAGNPEPDPQEVDRAVEKLETMVAS